jgi:hypothetical protein
MKKQKFIFYTDIFDEENIELLKLFLKEKNLNLSIDEFIEKCGINDNDDDFIDYFELLFDDNCKIITYKSYFICYYKKYEIEDTIFYICSETTEIKNEVLRSTNINFINLSIDDFNQLIHNFYEELKNDKLSYYIDTFYNLKISHNKK